MNVISSGSSRNRLLALVPFAYQLMTRASRPRDIAYLVASSWAPGAWIVHRLGGHGLVESAALYLLGYLAFVAFYEIGYFANDAWDAARSDIGRRRIDFEWGPGFAALFVALRLLLWAAIGYLAGWLWSPVWIAGYAALALAFTQHNLIDSAGFRSASFWQLATLRFMLPVLGSVPRASFLFLLACAILFYVYFRLLSYLDGKHLMTMPERRLPRFQLLQMLMLFPLTAFVAYATETVLFLELSLYFTIVFAAWALIAPGRGRAHPTASDRSPPNRARDR